MALSEKTKNYRFKYHLFKALSFILTFTPVVALAIYGIYSGTIVDQKVGLTMMLLVYLILTIIAVVNKIAFKSKVWVIIIGLYICLQSLIVPILIIGATQIIDELFITPIANHYKDKYKINKEIDKRNE